MFKTPAEAAVTAKALRVKLVNIEHVDVVVCPPAIDIVPVVEMLKESIVCVSGQNMHWEDEGAFTGEVSARMLQNAGCDYVVVGHSERRHVFGETNTDVSKKIAKAMALGLKPVFCVGEKLDERQAGNTESVVGAQVREGLAGIAVESAKDLVVAYEPVWAIGTGVTATPEQAEDVHRYIRGTLAEVLNPEVASQVRIQYGGSVKPSNAESLLSQENIDGALVGGASLDPDSFTEIIKTAENLSS